MRAEASLAIAVAALASLFTTAAHAEGEPVGFAPVAEAGAGFGAVGQLALSLGGTADEHFFFHKSGGAWQLQLAPAADYFIAPRVSVGGVVAFGHDSGGAGTNSDGVNHYKLAARVGYVFAFNDRFGLWPLGGLAVAHTSVDHGSSTETDLTIYAPFLFYPAPHFFVGAGPSFNIHLAGDGATEWGIDSMLGGWF